GGVELAVGPGVFIPRPETELLVDWAARSADSGATVLYLCSGSGAIALAMAHALPAARVSAVEQSPAAITWLRRDAAARAAPPATPRTAVRALLSDAHTRATPHVALAGRPRFPAARRA